jgi:hypothetical protein
LFGAYKPWEVEEIACMHQYIMSRIENVLEEVEDHFIYIVSSLEEPLKSTFLPLGDDKNADLQYREAKYSFGGSEGPLYDFEGPCYEIDTCMFMDCLKDSQHTLIAHLANFSFQYLRKLFEADHSERLRLISDNKDDHYYNIGHALKRSYCHSHRYPAMNPKATPTSNSWTSKVMITRSEILLRLGLDKTGHRTSTISFVI